ncbi:hypothetical protein C4544_07660 [candidate division WS5 bacterium]|uniref:SGNH/GDSL hydrolase family protein n=1 Tax=candidate division WS5 bacterium TaxID=2093353 RepID=A0A419D9V9_9BACT|nr:MAG: hypothetical protein C4544_07660 [candidate division WS5 bacterium]
MARFANITLGCTAFCFLSIFLYALVKSNLNPPGPMSTYYIFSGAGFILFAYVLLKCDVELKVKISLLTISVGVGIYALEFTLSYNKKLNIEYIRAKLAEKSGITYDLRHRTQVWMDLRNSGIEAYPLYNPYDNMDFKNSEILPLGFISGKTIIYCNESGEYIIFKTDEHGFNNPEGLYDEKNVDYVLIGDSFTQGACVKREENIAGRLKIAGNRVLNLGMLNSGPPKELAILKEYAKPLKPKIVFWIFYEGNDHEGLDFEKKSQLIMKYLDKDFSQELINKQALIDKLLIEQIEKDFLLLRETSKTNLIKTNGNYEASFNISLSSIKLPQLRRRLGFHGRECENIFDPLFKEFLAEAKKTVEDWDGELIFVYLPSYDRYQEKVNYCRKNFLDKEKEEVKKVVYDLQLPFIDIQTVIDSHPDPLSLFPFRNYGHFNTKGYELVAEHIDKYISNHRKKNGIF